MIHKFLVTICALVLPWLAAVPVATAASHFPVQVKVYGQHHGSQVTYHYQIVNNSSHNVGGVMVGWLYTDLPDKEGSGPELVTFPPSWNYREFGLAMPPGTTTSPPGWEAMVLPQEDTTNRAIGWGFARNNLPYAVIPPGATLGGMSVTLEAADNSYLNSHVYVQYSDGHPGLSVLLEKLDTAPPVLSVSVSPATLWPPNGKLIPITVTLTVKDDYDSQPEIKLESITANEALVASDIVEAKPGTDDRSFSLAAKREGSNKAGRIYTITYSATDASGNKTVASATVTVPHDQSGGKP